MNKQELKQTLTDFYMWMVKNGFEHNIRMRVENKADLFITEELQLPSEEVKKECKHMALGGTQNGKVYCFDCEKEILKDCIKPYWIELCCYCKVEIKKCKCPKTNKTI